MLMLRGIESVTGRTRWGACAWDSNKLCTQAWTSVGRDVRSSDDFAVSTGMSLQPRKKDREGSYRGVCHVGCTSKVAQAWAMLPG